MLSLDRWGIENVSVAYMNLKWKVEDGGELELQPFLRPCVKIPPLFNRMVSEEIDDAILIRILYSFYRLFLKVILSFIVFCQLGKSDIV